MFSLGKLSLTDGEVYEEHYESLGTKLGVEWKVCERSEWLERSIVSSICELTNIVS